MLYRFLDSSRFFTGAVRKEDRSVMNVPFVSPSKEQDAQVVAAAKAAGFDNLKGHKLSLIHILRHDRPGSPPVRYAPVPGGGRSPSAGDGAAQRDRGPGAAGSLKKREGGTHMAQAQRRIHFTMAFIGGFFGVYTILRFTGLFGSAQTANLIYLTTDLLGGSWADMLLRLGGAALYMAGIALTVWLPRGLSLIHI